MQRKKLTQKISKKIAAATIAALMILALAGELAFTNAATAYNPTTVYHTSYVYCSVSSSVLGLGQYQLLTYWTADMPPDTGETEGLINGAFNRAMWTGVTFTVTAPDNTSTTVTMPSSQQDSIGGGYTVYTPTQTGTYTVQANFPAQWKNSTLIQAANGTYVSTARQYGYPTPANQYYSADVSAPVTFVVQADAASVWNESPLPNDYWTRPINNANRLWNELGGNWLQPTYSTGAWLQPIGQSGGTTTRFVYGQGTETSHVLWTRQYYAGGSMDDRFNDTGYMTGHYQGLEFNAIILDGKIYYADRADAYTQQSTATGTNVIDLYTGQLLEYENTTMPAYGQIYDYESPNQHGGFSMLWRNVPTGTGTVWGTGNGTVIEMLDGYSLPLRHICYVANATWTTRTSDSRSLTEGATGTNVIGNNGEMLWYNLINRGTTANPSYYLTCWNNTNILGETATPPGTGTTYWQWRPEGGGSGTGAPAYSNAYIWNGQTGFVFNVSVPTPMNTANALANQTGTLLTVRVGDTNGAGGFVIIGTLGQNNERGNVKGKLWCLSLERGKEGTTLWTTDYDAPYLPTSANETIASIGGSYSLVGVYPEDNAIIFHSTKQLKYWAINMNTGASMWETTPEPDNNYYSTQYNYYNHMLLTSGYGGVIFAYDMATGNQVWNYTCTNVGGESPYGNYPCNIFAICDGKIYTLAGEHSVSQPMWRGPNLRCINATNGQEIWKFMAMSADNGAHLTGMYMQMGDGKVVGLNYYDNQIYCFGQGPSKTTVSAPQTISALGTSVTISGTVTDNTQSGRRNINNLYDFTLAGTPAISDASQEAWMEYLYEDQAKPTNATGVPVELTAIDPNGNYQTIGSTTSDAYGKYALPFTANVPGTYQIIATFAGTKAYGPSSDSTYVIVGNEPTTTPTQTPLTQSAADMYFLPAIAGLFVLIIIVAVVLALLMLRKK